MYVCLVCGKSFKPVEKDISEAFIDPNLLQCHYCQVGLAERPEWDDFDSKEQRFFSFGPEEIKLQVLEMNRWLYELLMAGREYQASRQYEWLRALHPFVDYY